MRRRLSQPTNRPSLLNQRTESSQPTNRPAVEQACACAQGPEQNLVFAVKLAMDLGLTEASKQLGLAKKNLRVSVSAPLYKDGDDGSRIPTKEWAHKNCTSIQMDPRKEQEDLLGKFRKQHNYMEKLVRQDIVLRDVSASSSQEAMDECMHSDQKMQSETLTSENSDLIRQSKTCSTRNSSLEAAITNLKEDVQTLSKKLEEHNVKLEEHNVELSFLKTTISVIERQLSKPSGMERIMMRNMLDQCRQKSIQILREQNVSILDENWRFAEDWHKVLNDSGCMQLLQNAGLDKGLSATRFGKRSLQNKGSSNANLITESPEVYATIVCKMTGDVRDQMENVFSFVFGCSAQEVAFGDDEFPYG